MRPLLREIAESSERRIIAAEVSSFTTLKTVIIALKCPIKFGSVAEYRTHIKEPPKTMAAPGEFQYGSKPP
jgi:hypothetical protein